MNNEPGPSKRTTTLPNRAKKRLRSAELEDLLRDSDEDIYAGSDVNEIDYNPSEDSESSSESEDDGIPDLEVERSNEVVSEPQISAPSVQQSIPSLSSPISPPPSAQSASPVAQSLPDQPSRAASTTRWSTTDSSSMRKEIPFTRTNELLILPPDNPRGYLDLFLSDDYLQKIVDCTNKFAETWKSSTHQRKSRISNWKQLTIEELKIFIGLLYHTGTAKMNRLVDYWKVHRLYKSVFAQYMSRNRFQLILRCLHFAEQENDDDRMGKCRLIIENFNNTMESIYYPTKHLSLDESMVLWRGRLIFRQYIKNKRHKYGIKLYILAEPNGTILKVHVYTSTLDETAGKGHTEKIVKKLLEGKLNAGHAVYMDNYYNSYDLAVDLLKNDTYCTGTLNKKRKQNPSEVMSKKLKKGENISCYRNGVHIGKWKDKREIHYLSTEFSNEMQEVSNKRGIVTMKPTAIINYNHNMSGVDLQDQMLSYYPCERKTLRWYMKIFVHTLMMSLINARMLYNKYSNQRSLPLYDFREKVIESFLPEINTAQLQNTLQRHGDANIQQHRLTKIEKVIPRSLATGKTTNAVARKDCRNCYKNKKRVNTTMECKNCPGNPPLCFDCFFDLHYCTPK